ncbi:ABC-three component system protein [Tenacibaculum sp. IMCC1]
MIRNGGQSDISIGGDGDVVGGNKITHIHNSKGTRLSRLFDALNREVQNDKKLQNVCEELNRYLTDKDTIGLERKLEDGGFDEDYIIEAIEQKEYFSKKLYKYQEYESAQFIYVDLLALIKTNFTDYIYPLLKQKPDLLTLNSELRDKIVNPILNTLNTDGAGDSILNLNAEEVKGMVYYLTGRCHIKWSK